LQEEIDIFFDVHCAQYNKYIFTQKTYKSVTSDVLHYVDAYLSNLQWNPELKEGNKKFKLRETIQ